MCGQRGRGKHAAQEAELGAAIVCHMDFKAVVLIVEGRRRHRAGDQWSARGAHVTPEAARQEGGVKMSNCAPRAKQS